MADVLDVARSILRRFDQIDTFKLQTLVYYSQAWHLVWDGEPMFPGAIEAWAAGPDVVRLYERHRGRYQISEGETYWGEPTNLSDSEVETINAVIEGYGGMSGRHLSALTHSEPPWRNAREGVASVDTSSSAISLADMYDYYSSLDTDDSGVAVQHQNSQGGTTHT